MTGVLGAIGDTPLVELERLLGRSDVRVWAKLEAANPGGSAKDRPAARIIADAIAEGSITAATTVVESSSGNMGVGLAQACRYHGVKLICVVDTPREPQERGDAARARCRREGRRPSHPARPSISWLPAGNWWPSCVESVPNAFNADQYANALQSGGSRRGHDAGDR